MKLAIETFVVSLLFSICAIAADTNGQWKVEVAGLRVVAPAPANKDELRAFNWTAGVTIALLVTSPQGKIIDFAWDESKITSFVDDKGTDLVAKRDHFHPDFELWSNHGEGSGEQIEVEAVAAGIPAKGANGIKVSGKMILRVAGTTNVLVAENVTMKEGTEFALGNTKLTVSLAEMREGAFRVTLSGKGDRTQFSEIQFQDRDGNSIEAAQQANWENTATGEFHLGYRLEKPVAKAKIIVAVWADLKTIEVPFSVQTGLGL